MKTNLRNSPAKDASILMIAIISTAVLGIVLLSYMVLIQWQSRSVARSQAWNGAVPAAEAGVEEALAHLNSVLGVTNTALWTRNGWALGGDGLYHTTPVKRDLSGGYYYVSFTPTVRPTIYATGYMTIPSLSAEISRAIELKTTNTWLQANSLVARSNINMNGNNVTTDSYNSQNGPWSQATSSTNGDVASMYGIVGIGNADINGSAASGPNGSISVGSQGHITGTTSSDFNMDFPVVPVPFTNGLPLPTATNKTYTLFTGQYTADINLPTSNGNSVPNKIVAAGNPTVLYVTGNFSPSVVTVNTGATLSVYVAGSTMNLDIVNVTGRPYQFSLYGVGATNQSITINGNDQFIGTIYAPNASVTMNGGGNNDLDFQGALVVQTVTMNGQFNFHYDESLRTNGPPGIYKAVSWREL